MRAVLRFWWDAFVWVMRSHRLRAHQDAPIGYSLAEVVSLNEARAAHEAAERDTWTQS